MRCGTTWPCLHFVICARLGRSRVELRFAIDIKNAKSTGVSAFKVQFETPKTRCFGVANGVSDTETPFKTPFSGVFDNCDLDFARWTPVPAVSAGSARRGRPSRTTVQRKAVVTRGRVQPSKLVCVHFEIERTRLRLKESESIEIHSDPDFAAPRAEHLQQGALIVMRSESIASSKSASKTRFEIHYSTRIERSKTQPSANLRRAVKAPRGPTCLTQSHTIYTHVRSIYSVNKSRQI